MKSFQELQTQIVKWRDEKGGSTLEGTIKHLVEEAKDLEVNPYDPLSLADVGILWMSLCQRVGFSMEEMAEAISSKMAINESRLWQTDEDGIIRHIEESKL
jgi:hypothetical protein